VAATEYLLSDLKRRVRKPHNRTGRSEAAAGRRLTALLARWEKSLVVGEFHADGGSWWPASNGAGQDDQHR
jgi:hypothetical protein